MNIKQLKARGQKIKQTLIERYGPDHFKKIGAKGGNPMLLKVRDEKLNKQNGKTD